MIVTGPTQCGKTTFVMNIIKNIDEMIVPMPDKVVFLYTTEQTIYTEMMKIVDEKKSQSTLKQN